jgi:hypothetical protein
MDKKLFEKTLERIKHWQVRIPFFIKKLTKEEAFIHGFDAGYRCKLSELEDKIHRFTPTFVFKEKK